MSVYVGVWLNWPKTKRWPYGGVSHLWADTPEELHTFAQSIGLRRAWSQGGTNRKMLHYDLNQNKRNQAIRQGVIEATLRQEGDAINAARMEADIE